MSEPISSGFRLVEPFKLPDNMLENKTSFYQLAKKQITYGTREECLDLRSLDGETIGVFLLDSENKSVPSGSTETWIKGLKIVINRGLIEDIGKENGEDFTVIIPYVVEHEIYEAWLNAKKGVGRNLEKNEKHVLARRLEFLLATQDKLIDKVYKFHMIINPSNKNEYDKAKEYVNRRLSSI